MVLSAGSLDSDRPLCSSLGPKSCKRLLEAQPWLMWVMLEELMEPLLAPCCWLTVMLVQGGSLLFWLLVLKALFTI